MFLEAVLADHSLDSRGFTYFVPEHLRESIRQGCVVEVPFGSELAPAVVTEVSAPPSDHTEAKSVVAVLVADPVVHPYQIEAAYALSKRYFIFLHTALSFFLPTPVFRRFLKTEKGYPEFCPIESAPESLSTGDDLRLESQNGFYCQPTLVYDREGIGAAKLFGSRLESHPGSVLVLPSDKAVETFLRDTDIDHDSLLVHTDSIPEARDFRLRLSVASRERPFLVWSRKLCSYNLAAYPNVFYFEDALFSEARHKFFHAYDNRFLWESFARSYPFRLTVSSFVPSSHLMALVAKGEWTLENA